MPRKKKEVVESNPEHDKLIETLKFTPRTYKILLWGYGGETVMGTVSRATYDFFRQHRISVSDYAWDYNDDNGNPMPEVPEELQPFTPGSWHDCDDMGHCWGVDRSAGTLQVQDENDNTVYEKSLDDISGMGVDEENPEASEPEWTCGDEVWIDSKPAGTVVFIGNSSEKGTFFEGEIELKSPFNPGLITLTYDEIDGNEIITGVQYDGEDIDNFGGDTSGKSSDFGFYIAGSQQSTGKWERYKDMDDINYTLTDWFPAKVNPVREGQYNIKTKDGYEYRAVWTGERWRQTWNEDKLKVTEWQGIAYDPDEHFLREELDRLYLEYQSQSVDDTDPVEFKN